MSIPIEQKSSVDEIKVRFDNDVERFSNLETGQTSTIDAPLVMDLIAQAASRSSKHIKRVLDILELNFEQYLSKIKNPDRFYNFKIDTLDFLRSEIDTSINEKLRN